MSLDEMVEEVEVSPRQVQRYLQALQECGVEIAKQWEPDRHGYHLLYRLEAIKGIPFKLVRRAQ
jgi:predicted DNA-binding transcriptional regulator YafY